ncbi:MAG: hypothetical protein PHN75_03080 [Syntrophales bacterium]|nr:hypothetical protein [Syntrophales bacterium]
MTAREIECAHCGLQGEIDGFYSDMNDREKIIFEHKGHDPFTGYLHYQCPACRRILLVHPMDVLEGKALIGVSSLGERKGKPLGQVLLGLLNKMPAVREIVQSFASVSTMGTVVGRTPHQNHAKIPDNLRH